MKRNNKQLYESIMKSVSKEIKRILNEEFDIDTYNRLNRHALRNMDELNYEFRQSDYQDEKILKRLQFLSRMSKKFSEQINKKTLEQVQGKLKDIINKWKNGVKINKDIEYTPIFELVSFNNENDPDDFNIYLNIYVPDFSEYNTFSKQKEKLKDFYKKIQDIKAEDISSEEKHKKLKKIYNLYNETLYSGDEELYRLDMIFRKIEKKEDELMQDLKSVYLTLYEPPKIMKTGKYKGLEQQIYTVPARWIIGDLQPKINKLYYDYLDEEPSSITSVKNRGIIKRRREL